MRSILNNVLTPYIEIDKWILFELILIKPDQIINLHKNENYMEILSTFLEL